MERMQRENILNDLQKKMVFIVGPRQVGKTWLAKSIAENYEHPTYLNYDSLIDRKIIESEGWPINTDLLILDEIHKKSKWKNYLKGVFDNRPEDMHMLITGSARLDAFRQSGDALTGRYFLHHLLPVSYKESSVDKNYTINYLIERGGFPEPLMAENKILAERWRSLYTDSLIQEEILDFERIHEIKAMRLLLELLRTKVGSPISYKSISEDLDVAPNTIKRYIGILEALYIIFRITPFSKNIARSLKKEPKIYFFDTGMVDGDSGVKFENFMAVSILKHCYNWTDTTGRTLRLHYLRTKEKKEVDFCMVENDIPKLFLEVKLTSDNLDKNLLYFHNRFEIPSKQVVRYLRKERRVGEIEITKAENFLKSLSI